MRKANFITKAKKTTCKAIMAVNVLLYTLASNMMSASAANSAPNGVDTTSYNTVVNLVMWIVIAGIGAAALPGIQSIVKGQTDNDMRERNAGIVAVVVAGCCIAGVAVIRNLCF